MFTIKERNLYCALALTITATFISTFVDCVSADSDDSTSKANDDGTVKPFDPVAAAKNSRCQQPGNWTSCRQDFVNSVFCQDSLPTRSRPDFIVSQQNTRDLWGEGYAHLSNNNTFNIKQLIWQMGFRDPTIAPLNSTVWFSSAPSLSPRKSQRAPARTHTISKHKYMPPNFLITLQPGVLVVNLPFSPNPNGAVQGGHLLDSRVLITMWLRTAGGWGDAECLGVQSLSSWTVQFRIPVKAYDPQKTTEVDPNDILVSNKEVLCFKFFDVDDTRLEFVAPVGQCVAITTVLLLDRSLPITDIRNQPVSQTVPEEDRADAVNTAINVENVVATKVETDDVEEDEEGLGAGRTLVMFHSGHERLAHPMQPVIHPQKANHVWLQGTPCVRQRDSEGVVDLVSDLGFDTMEFYMPFHGCNGVHDIHHRSNKYLWYHRKHNWFAHIERKECTMRYYIEPVILAINYAKDILKYDRIVMIGFSGGAWTTTLAAALDPRIDLSMPIAGSSNKFPSLLFPYSMEDRGFYGVNSDYEQQHQRPMYHVCGWICMYILGSLESHRAQLQILHENDECCFQPAGQHEEVRHYNQFVQTMISETEHGGGWMQTIVTDGALHAVTSRDRAIISTVLDWFLTPNETWPAGSDLGAQLGHLPFNILKPRE